MNRNPGLMMLSVVLLLIAGALYFQAGQMERRYQDEAERYLRQTLTELSDWRGSTLRGHLSDEARAVVDDASADRLLAEYRGLGALRRLEDIRFSRLSSALSVFSRQRRLGYSATGHYEDGQVDVTVTLLAAPDGLRIYNINFGRPVPLPEPGR